MGRQTARQLEFECSLGDDELLVRRIRGREALGECFEFRVDLLSSDPDVDINAVLGLNASVRIEIDGNSSRYVNGIVTEMNFLGYEGRYCAYHAVLRPWFWLLSRTANCRIFQEKDALQIVREIFSEHGFSDFEAQTTSHFPVREYCVQYRETDLAFVSRLLEEEGVYFYFRHERRKHVLVLADSSATHDTAPALATIPFAAKPTGVAGHFSDWRVERKVQAGKFTTRDFNFKMPAADLTASSSMPNDHTEAEREIFDYPGRYTKYQEGERVARTRMEEIHAAFEVVQGTCDARGLPCGALFTLEGHRRADQNKKYLVTLLQFEGQAAAYETGSEDGAIVYRAFVTAIDSTRTFRPPRHTPKPAVLGPQTAVVVGAGGDIWTDEHGRVKVQFHWDREGTHDEHSSCWVRVSQAWASASYGSMHIPHIGDEVVVSFLDGDPDRPLVTGRVYNGANHTWRPLPGEQSKSYFRDAGGNYIYMDESKGGERIELYSPYGQTKLSLGAPASPPGINLSTQSQMTTTVQGNVTNSFQSNYASTIQGTSDVTAVGKRVLTFGADVVKTVKGNVIDKVVGDIVKECLGSKKDWVKGSLNAKLTVGATHETFIGAKSAMHVGVKTDTACAASFTYAKGVEIKRGLKEICKSGDKSDTWKTSYSLKSGKVAIASTAGGIELKAAGTRISLSQNGKITISCDAPVFLKGTKIYLRASEQVMLKGPKVSATKGSFESKNVKDLG